MNFKAGNTAAKSEILRITDFMSKSVDKRLPRLDVWRAFGALMNPEFQPKQENPQTEDFRSLITKPVPKIEEITSFGALAFIFSEFRSIFSINGFNDYKTVEDSTIKCLLVAHKIKFLSPNITRVDLYAKTLNEEIVCSDEAAGSLLFEIYVSQKTSNGVCGSFGKLGNLYREGVRSKMGLLYLEANLRLHFVSPLEKASKWFEYVRKMWIRCNSQKAACDETRSKKRQSRQETVSQLSSDSAKSLTSKSIVKKRRLALRLSPMWSIKSRYI